MKKLVIAFAVLIMLAGGTVSILRYLEVGPFQQTAAEQAQVDPNQEQAKTFFDNKPRYIEFDPIQVPIFRDDGTAVTIMIHFKIEVIGVENEQKVARGKRQLSDALIKDFSYYLPQTLRNNKTLDVSLIKYRILMVSDRAFGKGIVNDALIQAMTSTDQ